GLTVGAFGSATSADAVRGAHGQRVCTEATAGEASCHALRLVDANGNSVAGPNATTPPASGKVPADIRDAYKLSGSSSGGRTASTGDNGYQGGSYPASSAYVTAVGGTSLARASGTARGWTETVWSGAGSGCSTYNTVVAPATVGTGCAKRAMADVSAVADPQT